jgi:diguanylate cyclase (GGDEF)-like protein
MVNNLLTIIAGLTIVIALLYYRRFRLLYGSVLHVLNNVPGGIIIATRRPHIVLCNRLVADTLGLMPVKVGEPQNFDIRDNAVLASICGDLFDNPLALDCEARSFEIVDQDGNYHRWDRHISSYRLAGRDLPTILLADRTELERLTIRLEQSSTHDALTGLTNRDIFHDRFGQALEAAARSDTVTAVLVVEIDDFGEFQNQRGWEAAKRALVDVAARLQVTTRAADTLARVGESSFAILLTGLSSAAAAARVAERFLKAIDSTGWDDGQDEAARCSIGVAAAPRDGSTSVKLLERATRACHRAQQAGGAMTIAYDPVLDGGDSGTSIAALSDMRRGFDEGEFFVEYQPIVELATGRPARCEALLRWRHPKKGLIPPAEFIPVAEQAGLIHQLGDFVFQTACRDAAAWPAGIGVSINASVIELLSGEWPLHLVEMLARAGLVTDRLSIEITETGSIASLARLADVTRQIRRLKVGVLLDDFGTGHSSLSQLSMLEFDGLKIDRQFIYDLADPRCAEIVRMLVEYCGPRGAIVIAEGVESAAQAKQLRAMGCTHAQGYFFGRPMAQADLLDRLRGTGIWAPSRAAAR